MAVLARWFYRRRRLVVAAWAAALLALVVASQVAGSDYKDSFSLPNTDSQSAYDLLAQDFPQQAGESDTIVWKALSGTVDATAVRARVDPMLASVARSAQVRSVVSPYSTAGSQQISADRTVAFATVIFDGRGTQIATGNVQRVVDTARSAASPAVQVELGGATIARASTGGGLGSSMLIGIVAAAVILFVAFGSILAMALPLVTAGVALGAALSLTALLSHAITMASFSSSLTLLIGLGVGVDYALFVVTRHRANLRRGMSVEEAAVSALNTSGRAVLFAGTTVCIALLGLLVLRVSFLDGLAISAAIGVALTMLAAVSLLPALLGYLGLRVLSRRQRQELAAMSPGAAADESGFWYRWARAIQRRPLPVALLAVVVMGTIAAPFFSIRLGSSDQGNDPTSMTTRRAYDLLAQGFGAGFNGPLQVVAAVPSPADVPALNAFRASVVSTADVKGATSPQLSPDGKAAIIVVYPASSPQDQATTDLINHVRNDLVPAAQRGTGLQIHIGGGRGPRVPEGLAGGSPRGRKAGADRVVPARLPLRHPVRPLHGLRGVPGQSHPRGMAAQPRQPACGHRGSGRDWPRHHGGRAHHGYGVHLVRLRHRARHQAVRNRPRRRRPARCVRRAHAPGSVAHAGSRQGQLVPAGVDGPRPAAPLHRARRGGRTCWSPDAGIEGVGSCEALTSQNGLTHDH